VLNSEETIRWAAAFGAAPEQIAKDHLVSHVIAAIGASPLAERIVLVGGTGLARTHLPHLRLSEDIDLWAEPAGATLQGLAADLPGRLRREFPACRLDRDSPESGSLLTRAGMRLRLQVLAYGAEYRRCLAVEIRPVILRYSDLPETVEMRVPTLAGFASMKHIAWAERAAPRDLVDLMGIAEINGLDADAAAMVRCLRGSGVADHELRRVPDHTRRAWVVDLARQMKQVPDPDEALRVVRQAWGSAPGWTPPEA